MNLFRFTKPNLVQGIALGLACNFDAHTITQTDDDWLLLAPYGETVYRATRTRHTRQVFNPRTGCADGVGGAFNALAARKGDKFRGLTDLRRAPGR